MRGVALSCLVTKRGCKHLRVPPFAPGAIFLPVHQMRTRHLLIAALLLGLLGLGLYDLIRPRRAPARERIAAAHPHGEEATFKGPQLRGVPSAPLLEPLGDVDEGQDVAEAAEDTGAAFAQSLREAGLARVVAFIDPPSKPDEQVWVDLGECEGVAVSRAPDRWVLAVMPGECRIQARRLDGMLIARSNAERMTLEPGEDVEVDLRLPTERTGGLGVQIRRQDGVIVVARVIPGSPAEAMGLEEGDLIVEVDGLPTEALELDEFIEVMTGPAGTDVEFTVGYDGDTGWEEEPLLLTRAVLEAS